MLIILAIKYKNQIAYSAASTPEELADAVIETVSRTTWEDVNYVVASTMTLWKNLQPNMPSSYIAGPGQPEIYMHSRP